MDAGPGGKPRTIWIDDVVKDAEKIMIKIGEIKNARGRNGGIEN